MSEDAPTPTVSRQARLLAPEHVAYLHDALRSLPGRTTREECQSAFSGPHDRVVARSLFGKFVRDVRAEDVLKALPRLSALAHGADPKASKCRALLERYAEVWLREYDHLLEALAHDEVPERTPDEAVTVATWLLGFERADVPAAAALSAALARIRELEGALQGKTREWQEERDRQDEQAETVREAVGRLHRLDLAHEALRKDVEALLRRADAERAEHLDLARRLDGDLEDVLAKHAAKWKAEHQADLAALAAELDEARNELLDARLDRERVLQAERSAWSAKVREREVQIENLKSRHHQQLREQQNKIKELELQFDAPVAPPDTPPTVPLTDDLLDQALVIHYPLLGADPVSRLADFFGMYRAFAEGRRHDPRLERVTNAARFERSEPLGVLVVGMEQLLEDGANVPLERLLRQRGARQESVLHGLIARVSSPRLEGNA